MKQPCILFVDDEQAILDLGVTALRQAGYSVMCAINGDIAHILMEQGVPFEVLITDIVLPGLLDGFALARKATELIPKIRIIYSTGFSGVARIRSRGAPFGEVLVKPWRGDDLVNIVGLAARPVQEPAGSAVPSCDSTKVTK